MNYDDPYGRVKRPDFQAPTELPSWLPMDSEKSQTPDMNPFVTALKKRMGQPKAGGPFQPEGEMSYSSMLGGGKGGGGTPESL